MKDLSDKERQELIKLAQNGDMFAQERLIRANKGLLVDQVNMLLGKNHLPNRDDCMQEAMLALLKAIKTYDRDRNKSFYNYASVCIRNALCDYLRSEYSNKNAAFNNRANVDPSSIAIEDTTPNPLETVVEIESGNDIEKLLDDLLSPLQKQALTLRMKDFSYKEIASKLGISEKTVDNALLAARRKLRKDERFRSML